MWRLRFVKGQGTFWQGTQEVTTGLQRDTEMDDLIAGPQNQLCTTIGKFLVALQAGSTFYSPAEVREAGCVKARLHHCMLLRTPHCCRATWVGKGWKLGGFRVLGLGFRV